MVVDRASALNTDRAAAPVIGPRLRIALRWVLACCGLLGVNSAYLLAVKGGEALGGHARGVQERQVEIGGGRLPCVAYVAAGPYAATRAARDQEREFVVVVRVPVAEAAAVDDGAVVEQRALALRNDAGVFRLAVVGWGLGGLALIVHFANVFGWPLDPSFSAFYLGLWLALGVAGISFVFLIYRLLR